MEIFIPDYVKTVIKTIENVGGQAYIVGGCVRDMLLGKTPDDFDVTTSLLPEKVLTLFEKTIATGIAHGTVTAVIDGKNVEITTYRTDGSYCDSRHPSNVSFVRSLKEDLARRDFTVNAIAYNEKDGIIDYFGGIDDLRNKILRAVGIPSERFSEDALRIMRLFRFACQLDFNIESDTLNSALDCAKRLENISRERIATELFKALCSDNSQNLTPLLSTGALNFIGITHCSVPNLSNLPNDRNIRFFSFTKSVNADFHNLCAELKTDKSLLNFCTETDSIIDNPPKSAVDVKKSLKKYSEKSVYCAMLLNGCDTTIINDVINSNQPYKISHLAVSGNDLITLGYTGKEIGEILDRLCDFVIEYPQKNKREILIKIIGNQ